MTYCVGMLMEAGLVFLSDTRTNAGVDQINVFRKMSIFEQPGDRALVLLSAGNLAITQAVVSLLFERQGKEGDSLLTVPNLFEAARHVGDCLREVHHRDAESLAGFNIDFNANFLLGGQIKGERPRLFNIYAAGNFVEATSDTPYFQIGESKYGKPILDRIFNWHSPMDEAAKCALISMDSTLKSNLSVGMPLDMLCYERDSLKTTRRARINADNAYFKRLREAWGEQIKQAFGQLPGMEWDSLAGR
ncbi:MAG: proteasome-type protease [Pseudomonadota bacterium]